MKLNIILLFSLLVFTLVFSGCGSADNNTAGNTANVAAVGTPEVSYVTLDEAGITIAVTKGFKSRKEGADTVLQTDDGVDVRFTVPANGDYDKAVSGAAVELDSYLDDIKQDSTKPEKLTVDGMDAAALTGTAKDKDRDVVWNLTVINTSKKPVLMNVYGDKDTVAKNARMLKIFLARGIKKQSS